MTARHVLSFPMKEGRFNFRVAGIIIADGHVLICREDEDLSLIHISEPTRQEAISYAVFDQLEMMYAEIAQKFGPAPLEELEISRVIDIAGEIRVFVIDADRKTMRAHAPRSSWTTWA